MFYHDKRLQYEAKPDEPDPVYAKKLQEILGGQFGEISVMMQYLFQAWNCRGPAKYRDMLLDIGTEEMAHIEMLATMICRLLEGTSAEEQEAAAESSSVVAAVLGGTSPKDMIMASAMNPQHMVVSGLGATASDSVGFPWTARYMIASGNLLADFRANLNAESQGRLQAVRLYEATTDAGVRNMLSFLIARDTMHQNQWLAAIEDLESSGLEQTPVPSSFQREQEKGDVAYQYWHLSNGEETTDSAPSAEGRWARGRSIDGHGEFSYLQRPEPLGPAPAPGRVDPRVYGTAEAMP